MPAGAMEVAIRYADHDGRPYRSLDAFDAAMRAEGRSIVLAMNAGMYHEDMSPVGLLVEDGRQIAPLQIGDGDGNFFLKPNGVFVVDDTGAALVMETQSYAASAITPHFATQSGPMLVVDGKIHPRFEPDGQSRHVRNGVGVRGDGTIVAAISLDMVSLGKFARLFRDGLGCPNALFLDGAISALSDGNRTLLGGVYPVGPILAVTARPATP
ncbi:MAG: phosphodiester glycosidase family protein [Rhizobiaceae bacterium]|nr:phosphodiester glycosidase family protein [Rhizobiaceae bacterium]